MKKIHKIVLFFVLIFLMGIYYFTAHIESTIDTKNEGTEQPLIIKDSTTQPEVIQIK